MELVIHGLLFASIHSLLFTYFANSQAFMEDVKIRFYYDDLVTSYTDYHLNSSIDIVSHPKFELDRPTVLYIHGWLERVDTSESIIAISNAYLQRNEHNVLVLSYEKLALMFYPIVVRNIPRVGKSAAFALLEMFRKGLDISRFHVIGFSLGAHVSSHIARTLRHASYTIPRITGLDPALPLFYQKNTKQLTKKDAKFVDIIHTDGGVFGVKVSAGHADFFPNGGQRPQLRCGRLFEIFDICSHFAAPHYYAESVTAKETIFVATNRLNSSDTAPMGYNCPATASGNYDLVVR
ncbi:Pancreatic triacylglycerol lipase [Pseudolycoriella hygida]|uniref:Pancreatic triacylglycerol lipase n=1 Tax=Pseudolycoriella hygida TaxID=35572 RepID=A0A9Q0MSE3_9DIPT|nr:Pancreatic triacylglycerol lipase [Pseudolycoriella hygida]